MKVPGYAVKAALAAMGAAGYKEGGPHPRAIGNIIKFYGCIVHGIIKARPSPAKAALSQESSDRDR